MSVENKTIKEIRDQLIAQIELKLNQTIPLLPKAFNRVLSNAIAAVYVILYKYCGFIALQIFVTTASAKDTTINGVTFNPLTEWGRLIGAGDPDEATAAEVVIQIGVTNQTGSLASGSQLVASSNGITYITIGSVLLDAPTVSIAARAASDQSGGDGSGSAGNLIIGDTMSFASPRANVETVAAVTSIITTAADAEDPDIYRQRILDAFQKTLQGGAYADYEAWSVGVAGIVNAYPYTSVNPGQVDVYVEATPESSGDPDGIPTAAQLQATLDAIYLDDNGLATRRPANALPNTFPITRTGFDVTVTGVTGVSDLAQVIEDIEAALEEYFLAREPYIAGLTLPPRQDRITESTVGGIVDDVVGAAGGIFTSAEVFIAAAPTPLHQLGNGEKSKLLSLTVS